MKRAAALAAALLAATPVTAQDIADLYGCTLATAIYRQPTTDWVLRFHPVNPQESPPNQRNAFTLDVPGGRTIDGGIFMPNGFTIALGIMDLDGCPQEDRDRGGDDRAPGCGLWQGTVYGDGPSGIGELVDENAVPPLQVLFPMFATGLWYSYVPDIEFRDIIPLDAFTFAGCAK